MSNSPFSVIRDGFGDDRTNKEMRAPIIKEEEIVFGKLIASGAFGEVFGGTCRGKSVAMKRLPAPEDQEEIDQILNEMEIVINVRHPNVVLFMGVCIEQSGDIIIVQELMDCDLFTYLRKNKITLVEKLAIITQIAEGMSWLHGGDPMILHSDLKPENVLMDSMGNAKICDFGLSSVARTSQIERDGIIGTPLYMGPEALMEESIGKAADVYSFAVVAWAIFNVQEPFSHIQDYESLVDAVVYNNERPPLRDIEKISPELVDLMNRMWAPEPTARPSFPEITLELKGLIASVALPGFPIGQDFWSSRFGSSLEVPYAYFKEELCVFLELEPTFYKTAFQCLDEVVECKNGQPLKLTSFSNVLFWFGDVGADEAGDNILDRILDIFKCPWFYGPISSKQAVIKLSVKNKKGAFLVRLNTGEKVSAKDEPFRISAVAKSGVLHYCVKNKTTNFEVTVTKKRIQSAANIKDCVEVMKKVLKLKSPCAGRDYDTIFENTSVLYAYEPGADSTDESF